MSYTTNAPLGTFLYLAMGECEGHISLEEKGDSGFGYDSVFVPEGEVQTFGELGIAKKNLISHRANALKKLSLLLEDFTNEG